MLIEMLPITVSEFLLMSSSMDKLILCLIGKEDPRRFFSVMGHHLIIDSSDGKA